MIRSALIIARKDLRERIRDRTVLILGVAAPFALAAIFSLLLPSGDDALDLTVGFVDADGTEVSQAFRSGALAGVERAGIVEVTEYGSTDAAHGAVDDGEVGAAIVIPSGFGAAAQAGGEARIEVIANVSGGISAEVARALAAGYAAELEAVQLSVATAIQLAGSEPPPPAVEELAHRAGEIEVPIRLEDQATQERAVGATTFYAASMAIFFLFFTAQFGVLSLLAERRRGTLPRLVAAPIRPASIILGKAFGTFGLGILAMTVLVVASTLLLGAEWGNPVGVALLVVSGVLAAMGITAMITTLARTEEQAGGWNGIVAVTLAILGGTFFPLSQGPEILSRLTLITPHAWFLRGMDDLSVPTAGPLDVLPSVLILLGFAVVTGAIGLLRAGSLVVRR